MVSIRSGWLLPLVCSLCIRWALAGKVKEISAMTFGSMIENAKKPILVEFYSPDCFHSQKLEPVLEEVAVEMASLLTIARLDMRHTHKLNRMLSVRQSPTLLFFQDGEEVVEARPDLQGMRTKESLSKYVSMFLGNASNAIQSLSQIDERLEAEEVLVLGLLESDTDKYAQTFKEVAQTMRRHVRFVHCADADALPTIAEAFEVADTPALLIVKRGRFAMRFEGAAMTNRSAMLDFVNTFAHPLVGEAELFNYARFKQSNLTKLYLIYEYERPFQYLEVADMLERFAKEHPDVLFMAVHERMTEGGSEAALKLHQELGASDFRLPALVLQEASGRGLLVFNQMRDVTPGSVAEFFDLWARPTHRLWPTCQIDSFRADANHSQAAMDSYLEYARLMKSRLYSGAPGEKEPWRQIREQAFRTLEKQTKRDILTIYTARWCVHSLMLEQQLKQLVNSGALAELLEEDLTIVLVDVVESPPWAANRLETVPALRYLPARYKNLPFWYNGDPYNIEGVEEWIRAYHSMRYVEIPGEGPSPFAAPSGDAEAAATGRQAPLLGAGSFDLDLDDEDVHGQPSARINSAGDILWEDELDDEYLDEDAAAVEEGAGALRDQASMPAAGMAGAMDASAATRDEL